MPDHAGRVVSPPNPFVALKKQAIVIKSFNCTDSLFFITRKYSIDTFVLSFYSHYFVMIRALREYRDNLGCKSNGTSSFRLWLFRDFSNTWERLTRLNLNDSSRNLRRFVETGIGRFIIIAKSARSFYFRSSRISFRIPKVKTWQFYEWLTPRGLEPARGFVQPSTIKQ